MKLTLHGLAEAMQTGRVQRDTLILPWTTADQVVGWLYREPASAERTGVGVGEYADAGEYEVLPASTAAALDAWRAGGPPPFLDRYPGEPEKAERLCLSVWPASHIVWKAEQDYLSGGA